MTPREMLGDADGEIAAMVYTSGQRPDVVLCAFAEHLAKAGRRVCGLVQFRDHAADTSRCRLMVLDSWQMVDVTRKHDAAGSGCRLDSQWLDQMGRQAKASIRRGVDAVIVNRFGPLEAAGRGFCDAILAASETETPLVIAVPQWEFARWTRFSSGMAVRLDCTLDSVLDWWRRISHAGVPRLPQAARACELMK